MIKLNGKLNDNTALQHPPGSDLVRILANLRSLSDRYRTLYRQTRNYSALRLRCYDKNGRRYYLARSKVDGQWKDSYLGTDANPTVRILQKRRYLKELIDRIDHNIQLLERAASDFQSIDLNTVMGDLPRAFQTDPLTVINPSEKAADHATEIAAKRMSHMPEQKTVEIFSQSALKNETDALFGIASPLLSTHGMQLLQRKKILHPEHLIHRTAKGLLVRSKSEVIISNCLFARSLPYLNEPLIACGNKFLSPDFLVLSPAGDEVFLWEHWGLLTKPGYLEDNLEKLQAYQMAGFTPQNNLIITADTTDGDLDSYRIERILDLWFG